ncbi:MAG: TetR/AcrR family transcriptional regulator [Acetatifactor sp.]|nr:TetR/AcrR family transcriptional regulator [Acetatifactor sp.]
MDLRIEKTKRCIINAFIELRSKKELEKIKVKELCEKAQINKSTFYAHYRDIYDLSEQLENEVVASLMEELDHPENVIENPPVFIQELFEGCLAKDSLINILFSGVRNNLLIEKIESALMKLIHKTYPQLENDIEKNIMLTYTIYGGYYAFFKNRKYGDEVVINTIGGLSAILK